MIKLFEEYSLRPFVFEDAESIFKIIDAQRDYLRVWLPFVDATFKVEDTQNGLKLFATPENPHFCILHKKEVIGIIGFKDTCRLNRKTEIGYWLSSYHQGRGVMTCCVEQLLKLAFEQMEMNRVVIRAAVGNHKSRNIPARIGFVQEGIERQAELLVDQNYTDLVLYSILRREYIEKIEDANN